MVAHALPQVYTVDQVVEELKGKLGRTSIYEAIRRGDIPSLRIGGRYLIPEGALRDLLEGGAPDAGHGA